MKDKIELGNKLRCKVTGFTGIAIARIEYLNGCVQYGLKPKVDPKTNKIEEVVYIDDQQLGVVGRGLVMEKKITGGPSTDAPKHGYRV